MSPARCHRRRPRPRRGRSEPVSEPAPVEVRGLSKSYGDLVAVDEVDLTVEAGDVFGYLGPNGAGKTGLIAPTAGTVRLFGRDPQASVKALEGVAGFVEAPSFYPYLSGRTNLDLLAALDGDGAAGRIEGSGLPRRVACPNSDLPISAPPLVFGLISK